MSKVLGRESVVERFAKYISFDTQSNGGSETCPSTQKQFALANYLVEELKGLGLEDASVDENGYVMATLPASSPELEKAPVLGLIAHMDTAPDAAGGPVKWRIVENYDGADIVLNNGCEVTDNRRVVLSAKAFPELLDYVGQDIMVTDGTTLLGADDKAGITAIISAVEYMQKHKELQHGKVRLGFTPDEEIGRGADKFDVEKFGADFAYTFDGGAIGGMEYETFNAANLAILIRGRNVHTGAAKNKMINALTIAAEWQMMLPADQQPETTENYEGFYHVHTIKGDVSEIRMGMLVRDHDRECFEKRKAYLHKMAELLNERYGEGTVTIAGKDVYYNMREKIEEAMWTVDVAKNAMLKAGVTPVVSPIRGGTDGARLSFMGLPCPNIFTGGMNYHGVYEYLPINSLLKSAETAAEIILGASELKK